MKITKRGRPQRTLTRQEQQLRRAKRKIYLAAYADVSMQVMDKKPAQRPPPEKTFRKQVVEYLKKSRDDLHRAICVEFDYCTKREKWGSKAGFLQGTTLLIGAIAEIASCSIASATWLVTSSALDEFCECKKKKKAKIRRRR